jgi:hypothetical protein
MDVAEVQSKEDDSVWVNYHFGFSRVILPSIYYKNPEVLVSPRKTTPLPWALMLEDLINYQLEEIDFEREMRKIILDALFAGYGVMKFGYAPALTKKKRLPDVTKVDGMDVESILSDIFSTIPGEMGEEKEIDFDPNQNVTGYNPFALRVSPKHFRIDPHATCLEDARWVAHIILKTVEEVKNSKLYSKGLTKGIEGTTRLEDDKAINEDSSNFDAYSSYQNPRGKTDQNLVILYEIWDRETNKMMVLDSHNMASGSKKFLREEDWPYEIDGFPFELLVFNPDPDYPFGVSDAMVWNNPASAVNLINTMQYNHAKRALRKYLMEKGSMDEEEITKLIDPIDMAIAQTNGPPDGKIIPLQDASLSPDIYALGDKMRTELTFLTGVTEQRKGGGDSAKTATEASIIEGQARIRDSDRLYLVSKFVERSSKKIIQLDRQFLGPEDVAFVTGEEALYLWQQSSGEILRAEVDLKVRIGSSAFVSREVRTKQLIDFMNVSAGLVDPFTGMPVVNVRELVRRVAESLEIDDFESLLAVPMMPGMMPGMGPGLDSPLAPVPPGAQGPAQAPNLRNGTPNLGAMLSGVQNLGVRRTPPNPTNGDVG